MKFFSFLLLSIFASFLEMQATGTHGEASLITIDHSNCTALVVPDGTAKAFALHSALMSISHASSKGSPSF